MNHTCSSNEFTCANGRCTPQSWVCDAENDCGDLSDEQSCPPHTCLPTEFSCQSPAGACIPQRFRCDHQYDCSDGSDEMDCRTYTRCPSFSKVSSTLASKSKSTKSRCRLFCRRWLFAGDKKSPATKKLTATFCRLRLGRQCRRAIRLYSRWHNGESKSEYKLLLGVNVLIVERSQSLEKAHILVIQSPLKIGEIPWMSCKGLFPKSPVCCWQTTYLLMSKLCHVFFVR